MKSNGAQHKPLPIFLLFVLMLSSSIYSHLQAQVATQYGDCANGWGVVVFKNQDVFAGYWKNGERTGYGLYIWGDDKSRYFGGWEKSARTGFGVFYDKTGKILNMGYWDGNDNTPVEGADVKSGYVYKNEIGDYRIYRWDDGTLYHGFWRGGEMDGTGCYMFPDGSVASGAFSGNKMEGEGVMFWTNGQIYVGTFTGGNKSGPGVYLDKRGEIINRVAQAAAVPSGNSAGSSVLGGMLAQEYGDYLDGEDDEKDSEDASVGIQKIAANAVLSLLVMEAIQPGVLQPKQVSKPLLLIDVWGDGTLLDLSGVLNGSSVKVEFKSLMAVRGSSTIDGYWGNYQVGILLTDLTADASLYLLSGKAGGKTNSLTIKNPGRNWTTLNASGMLARKAVKFDLGTSRSDKHWSILVNGTLGSDTISLTVQFPGFKDRAVITGNIGNTRVDMEVEYARDIGGSWDVIAPSRKD